MKSDYTTFLFDLDGTLVDHFDAILYCYNQTALQFDRPPVSLETLKATVGGSVPVTMRRLFGEDLPETAIPRFREIFKFHYLDKIDPLPGAEDLLKELHSANHKVALFTNKDGSAARSLVRFLGWDQYFNCMVGAQDTPWRKPEKAFSEWILGSLSSSPEESLLIGDSPYDVAAAEAVGMDCWVVATGSHSKEQLEQTTAKRVLLKLSDAQL